MEETQATFSLFDVGFALFLVCHRYGFEAVTMPRMKKMVEKLVEKLVHAATALPLA